MCVSSGRYLIDIPTSTPQEALFIAVTEWKLQGTSAASSQQNLPYPLERQQNREKGGNRGGGDGGGGGGEDVTVASANVRTMMHAARVDSGSRWQRRRPPANPYFSRALTSPAQ